MLSSLRNSLNSPFWIVLALFSVLGLTFSGMRGIILPSFAMLERQEMSEDAERCRSIIASELQQLATTAGDYAGWDEAYSFVQTGSPDFIKTNINPAIFNKLRLNMFVYTNNVGAVVYGKLVDWRSGAVLPFSPALLAQLSPGGRLIAHSAQQQKNVSGLLQLPEGVMLVVSQAVLTSGYLGPSMGTLVVGRYLDAAEVAGLASRIRLPMTLMPGPVTSSATTAKKVPDSSKVEIMIGDADTIIGAVPLSDINGLPAGTLRIEKSRRIYQQGMDTVNTYFLLTVLITIIIALLIAIFKDRLRQVKQLLLKSEEQYRAMIDAFDGYMYICSKDFRIEFMNDKLIERTGRNATGEYCYKALHDLDTACEWCVTEQNIAGKSACWEMKSPKDDRWYEVKNSPINNADGSISKQAMITDITDRKQAEEKLKKSEALYHSLVETSQDLIWRCDAEGRYTYLNLAWEQVFGYELDEMLGKKFSDFQTPENAARYQIEFNRLMEGYSVTHFESTHIGKSGNEIHLVFNALFVSDENGEIVGTSGTAYDITDRKLMEAELLKAKATAEVANNAKSQFLATMSHEIRTPMNGVIGMIELLQHTELTQEQLEYAESAKNAGSELVHLLNDILDLSKVEADKLELETSDFDLLPVISDTINLLSLQAREKGVELTSSIDTGVPTALKGDAGRLRQILTNLIGNAIKFTPKGAVMLQTRIDVEDEHSVTLRFLVRDSGIGIAADKLENIFEPFTQADSSTTRRYGGTGLGLTICKRLAEMMGGAIGAESTEGQASTFWFTAVLEKQIEEASALHGYPVSCDDVGSCLPKIPTANGIRILLTEDDPRAQKIVPKLLKNYGYLVDVAGDGKEALQALENDDYALVLMDCMMPELNGYDVTAIIRDPGSSVRRHDIPVIALTGNAMKQDYDKCIAAGMDDHLSKPLILDDLLSKLDIWLREKVN